MTITVEHPDKTTHINNFVDKLFLYYDAKWLDQNKKPLYKSSIMGIFSMLEASEINEIETKIFQNFKYIPHVTELTKFANHYAKRTPVSVVTVSAIKNGINKYNYTIMDFDKAVIFMRDTLEMIYTKESVTSFLNIHDMQCKGFIESDLEFFAERFIGSGKVLESYDIIKMLNYIQRTKVLPRVERLRGRPSTPEDLAPMDRKKYAVMARMLVGKCAPQLVSK